MKNRYKKRIRLKHFDYTGSYRYFITICTINKKPIFTDSCLVNWFIEVLKEESKDFGFLVWACCFMPDHLHLLIEGKDENSHMKKFVSSYKQKTGFYYKKKYGTPLWQINYYEHVLRKNEDTRAVARYIFNNPVRKGIVDDYREYAFLGSFEFDVRET